MSDGRANNGGSRANSGRKSLNTFTPSEILFEIQLQKRGFIEIDVAVRTKDPFKYERHTIGEPTRIIGLEPGEIMKLRRDLQAFLVWWRGDLARERNDAAIEQRMEIGVFPSVAGEGKRRNGRSKEKHVKVRKGPAPPPARDVEGRFCAHDPCPIPLSDEDNPQAAPLGNEAHD